MSEIKIREYVRTKAGIGKIVEIFKCDDEEVYYTDTYIDDENENSDILYEHQILKHSKNIIDLIEAGDIIEYIDDLENNNEYIKSFIVTKTELQLKEFKEYLKNYCKIISVLTKEQYEQNCYKLEE